MKKLNPLDVLKAKNNIFVKNPYAVLWGRKLSGGYEPAEATGTLPLTFRSNGTALLDYRIYGNTEQTGTPTPSSPIYPTDCGERTENLINIVQPVNMSQSGYIYNGDFFFWGENLTINSTFTSSVAIVGTDGTEIFNGVIYANTPYTVQTPNGVKSLRIYAMSAVSGYFMLNSGSTPLPYEPYGYKLPLTLGSTTTDIYLGEVQSTRRVKKLVLTGEEDCYRYVYAKGNGIEVSNVLDANYTRANGFCSHYPVYPQRISNINSLWIGVNSKSLYFVGILDTLGISSVSDFKAFLAQQYANGTPVTIWYVPAEPETGIVNEPLMKIGNYADTVSKEQAGVSIPTNKGTTVIDYNGTLKPSNVYIKYRS